MARSLLLLTSIGLALISRDASPKYRPSTRAVTRFVESRGKLQGETWLSWGADARLQFVRGLLVGYLYGGRQACSLATSQYDLTTSRKLSRECEQNVHHFRQGPEYYADFVTNFYLSYPDDRDIPMRMLIEFADEKNVEQIHDWRITLSNPVRYSARQESL